MSRPEPPADRHGHRGQAAAGVQGAGLDGKPSEPLQSTHYGRHVGVLGLLALVLITINTALTKPNGATAYPQARAWRRLPCRLPQAAWLGTRTWPRAQTKARQVSCRRAKCASHRF